MKNLLGFCVSFLVVSGSVSASTNCTQTFKLLRFDGNDTFSIVFQEIIDGECLSFDTYTLKCSPADTILEPIVRGESSEMDSYFLDSTIEITETDGKFSLPDNGQFSAPTVDSALLRIYENTAASHHAQVWYQYCETNCLEEPEFDGVVAQRLYYHPRGLYINYKIKSAFYDISTRLLLIFTDQPRMASGFDTMHGVLLYRILR